MIPRATFLLLSLLLGASLAGCVSTVRPEPIEPAAVDTGEAEEEPQDGAGEKERELSLARLGLSLAEFDTETSSFEARLALEHARRDAEEDRRAHEHFTTAEAPHELEKATLSLDRARYRAEETEAELVELERMYAQESFAEITKELVLQRGRRSLELARRDLELAEARLAMLEAYELPKKEVQLEQALGKAREAVELAERKVRRIGIDNERKLLEARAKVAKAKKALETDEDEEGDEE